MTLHALTPRPGKLHRPRMMCELCCGHAYARGVCVVCMLPLCKKHIVVVDEKTYCRKHKPGYQ